MTATKRKPKPITAHPLFPVVTALWFGTFLGLGSFAVAPSLLEGPVVALGIPALVPAAAPPLGFTARVMLALGMLLAGGILGFVIGRRLARPKVEAPARNRTMRASARQASDENHEAAVPSRRLINPAEDLGEPLMEPAAESEWAPLRRRSLTSADEDQQSVPSESAPLPGPLPWEQHEIAAEVFHNVERADALETASEWEHAAATFADPLMTNHAEAEAEAKAEAEAAAEPAQPSFEEPAFTPAPLFQAVTSDANPLVRAAPEELGLVQLVERLALAISRRSAPRVEASARETAAFQPQLPKAPVAIQRDAVEALAAWAAPEPVAPAVVAAPAPFAERVVHLRPAALQPLHTALDDGAEADEAQDLPELGRFLRAPKADAMADADSFADETASDEADLPEDRYPSLLDMGPCVVRHDPVRIDDGLGLDAEDESADEIEPVVVFPGQASPIQSTERPFERPSITPLPGSPLAAPGRAAPSSQIEEAASAYEQAGHTGTPDPEEADRALRAALATLQRMTAQG